MTKKDIRAALITLAAIGLNLAGKGITSKIDLPLWLDTFGTVWAAYSLGPFVGAVVGGATNIIYGFTDVTSLLYAVVSIVIGILTGIFARKGSFKTFSGTMGVCAIVTLAATFLSTPINALVSGGMTGNAFGNGVYMYFRERGFFHNGICMLLGEFYIDFLDKVIAFIALYLCLSLNRKLKKKNINPVALMLAGIFIAECCIPFGAVDAATVDKKKEVDFFSYDRTVYGRSEGLLAGEANDIVQTKDGALWIGTYAGLFRYNGNKFEVADYPSVKNVNCLYVDDEGRMWIGTNDNGLSLFIGDRVTNVLDMESGLPSNSIRSITCSSDGDYYMGTSDALQVMDIRGGLTLSVTLPSIVYAHSLSSDKNGHVAAVTQSGTLFLIKDREIITQAEIPEGYESFSCCAYGEDGLLYVGNQENKIFVYDTSNDSLVFIKMITAEGLSQINSIHITEDGLMFLCADNGVGYLINGRYKILNVGDFSNSIDHMLMDYQGNYWFTSSRLGIMRLAKSSFSDVYGAYGAQRSVANSTAMWKAKLYVGTDNGLDCIDMRAGGPYEDILTDAVGDARVRCVSTDDRESIWVCTYGKGLICCDKYYDITYYNKEAGNFGDYARVCLPLSDGSVAAAGDEGFIKIKNGVITEHYEYGNKFLGSQILCFDEQEDGTILVGSDGDGIAVIKDGAVQRRIGVADGLGSGVILRIVKTASGKGNYIVLSNGIAYMDEDYSIRNLDRFPYTNNYDIKVTEDGKLFVLGSAGIFVVDESDLLSDDTDALPYELLDEKRGLTSNITVNAWNTEKDGIYYLSCDNGVVKLNLNDYGSAQKSYRMKLNGIEVDGVRRSVERGETFVIPRDSQSVVLNPEVINYTLENPDISYRLYDVDAKDTVVPLSELSTISYKNIPAGEHRFRMAVLDPSGKVIEESNYMIGRQKELFEETWFEIYLLAVGILAVVWFTWVVVRLQMQRVIKRQKEQIEMAQKQVQMGNETIIAIARTVDAKDERTSQHSQRVSEYSVMIAKEMGFSDEECENLRKAALLHDIGKIGIPDNILNKPARLTDDEYAVMKSHVSRGADILKDFTMIDHVVEGALYHHERYDGNGYVNGLKGEDIPIYGRIIGVADAFDAMTQNRVYRKKLDMDFVKEELKRCSGSQFDPEIAEIMLRLVEEGKIDPSKEINTPDGGDEK
ncbi:MAG: HD domain-containing protein [Lachnospiraceae bacterium]|nr:HD domain-containing protein [Lachnospiraceae bacterium]